MPWYDGMYLSRRGDPVVSQFNTLLHDLRCPNPMGYTKVAEGGRRKAKSGAACAKRRSIGQMLISAELENVREASGKLRGSSDLLELFRKMLHFGKIGLKSPKKLVKFGEHSTKFWQNLRNFGKNSK